MKALSLTKGDEVVVIEQHPNQVLAGKPARGLSWARFRQLLPGVKRAGARGQFNLIRLGSEERGEGQPDKGRIITLVLKSEFPGQTFGNPRGGVEHQAAVDEREGLLRHDALLTTVA